ncbi:BMP family ABC transporter substrate-binding protein [Actinomycetaceae bacterium MB13-C1-2]|nr:BMP family ABC transporter substrate-binding protein [Actinomycetaceae bacterium MB13-C1-2]
MKTSRRSLTALAAGGVLAMVLAACGSAPSGTESDSSESGEQSSDSATGSSTGTDPAAKVCMVAGLGGLDDKSFNQSGWEGLQRARDDLGIQIEVSETFSDEDYVPHIENMVQEGCDMVVGVSFMMTQAMTDAAKKYPDVKFALVDDVFPEELPNAKGVVFNAAEATYLAGYLAAGMTKTGSVGVFLGGKIVPTMLFADGYVDGVAKYNEVHGTDVKVVGWDKEAQDGIATGDFENVQRGLEFTKRMIDQGVDIILPVAGTVGSGALAAAAESKGVSVIWVDVDGYYSEPDYAQYILTSVLKEIGNALYTTVEELVNDQWSDSDYIGTLSNEGVGLAPWHDFEDQVPAELSEEIDQIRQDIIDGKIDVTSTNAPS